MNLPSLSYIYGEASKTVRRFPFALLTASIAALSAVWLMDLGYEERQANDYLNRVLMVATLGISWFTVIVLTLEKLEKSNLWSWFGQLAGLVILTIYYFTLPDHFPDDLDRPLIRYLLFFLGVHLLVAIAPFWTKGEINGFWHYNKTLFLRFLTAFLYSHVLYIGLAVALLSIENLFGVDVPAKWYSQLWVLIVGIFNTWFFLSGIPRELSLLDQKRTYPKGLKVFTRFILIPLVIIYLIILYLYTGKIIIEWQWPEGWVAILVLSFSVAGIFSLLLLHPIQEKVENRWIKSFSKYYYISLVPLVFLLLLAIWRRITEYGFTENRYFVLVLGLWLAGLVAYFMINKTKNIKVIPASLCIITFLASFGPWGAFSISENSQINRLESLLTENEILVNGTILKPDQMVPREDVSEISAVVRYLSGVHGLDGIQPWFEQDLEALATDTVDSVEQRYRWSQPREVVELMGLEYVTSGSYGPSDYRSFTSSAQQIVPLEGYEWLVKNRNIFQITDTTTLNLGPETLVIESSPDSLWFIINLEGGDVPRLKIDLEQKINQLDRAYTPEQSFNIPPEQMVLEADNQWISVRLHLNRIDVQRVENSWNVQSLFTDILISLK